jgi:Trypsin-co-occurring domain 1
MPARMLVELPAGKKIFLGGQGAELGLAEIGLGGDVARVSSETFKGALGSLAELVAMLEGSVGHMAHRPDKVEMEFGATFGGDCNLWIVSGKAEAEFKVTLSWGKGE